MNSKDFFRDKEYPTDGVIILIPVDEKYWKEFFEVRIENQIIKGFYEDRHHQEVEWESMMQEDDYIYCFVLKKDSHEFVGYCALSKMKRGINELSIELLKIHTNKGYGKRIIRLFTNALKERVNLEEFVAVIDPENSTSQHMFEKLGAKPSGIRLSVWLRDTTGERALEFEESHINEITEHMIVMAEKFAVEPRKLLSHNLVYALKI